MQALSIEGPGASVLIAAKHRSAIRICEPFAAIICCISDPLELNAKTRSKWSRVLRFAERFKPNAQGLAQFIKSQGGIVVRLEVCVLASRRTAMPKKRYTPEEIVAKLRQVDVRAGLGNLHRTISGISA
jgi:hypothetical protein